MGSKNDGQSMQFEFAPRQAGQDRKHFPLGTSTAVPAPGYFAGIAGLENEQMIKDAIAGLSDSREIEDALVKILYSRRQAQDFMRWRLKMRNYAKRP